MNMRRLMCLAVLACAAAVLVWVPAAAAGAVECTGGTDDPLTGEIVGNVVVPAGASCRIQGTVTGNVTAEAGSQLGIRAGSAIGGNVTCDGCTFFDLHGSTVHGNVSVRGEQEGSFIDDSTIDGNLTIEQSSAGPESFSILRNHVARNFSFNGNSGTATLENNTVGGNLTCEDNTPPPATSGNTANKTVGQCA
jgi:hypothetical protein